VRFNDKMNFHSSMFVGVICFFTLSLSSLSLSLSLSPPLSPSLPLSSSLALLPCSLLLPSSLPCYSRSSAKFSDQLWVTSQLSFTKSKPGAVECASELCKRVLTSHPSCLQRPSLENVNRPLPKVWSCNGNLEPVNDASHEWAATIVLSYPVNQHHLAWNSAGTGICLTFQHIRHRLLAVIPEARLSSILITDIYPYVGHPSALGRPLQGPVVVLNSMEQQANNILSIRAPLIILAAESARVAFHKVLRDTNIYEVHDCTSKLGIPSCLVVYRNDSLKRSSLIIVEPHPSNDRYTQYDSVFQLRMSYVGMILLRRNIDIAKDFQRKLNRRCITSLTPLLSLSPFLSIFFSCSLFFQASCLSSFVLFSSFSVQY
jgi:hypothetical protein